MIFKSLIQYFLRSCRDTGTWTKCRTRHKTGSYRKRLSQYRQSKVFIMTFIRLVWAGLLEVSAGLVPGPALYPGTGATERPQKILYIKKNFDQSYLILLLNA